MRSAQTHIPRMRHLQQSRQKKYADSGFCAKAAAGEFDLTEEELKAFEEKRAAEKTEAASKEKAAPVKEAAVQVNFDKTKVDISKVRLPGPGEGYKLNWEETKEKFRNYWAHKNTGRPLMCVIARRPEIEQYSDGTPVDGGYLGQICQANTTICRMS